MKSIIGGKDAWYSDNYSNADLIAWNEKLMNIPSGKLFAYFNNDAQAYAVNNGRYFASLISV